MRRRQSAGVLRCRARTCARRPGHRLGRAAPAGRGQLRPAHAGDGAEERRPRPGRSTSSSRRARSGSSRAAPHALPRHPLCSSPAAGSGACSGSRSTPSSRRTTSSTSTTRMCAATRASPATRANAAHTGVILEHPAAAARPRTSPHRTTTAAGSSSARTAACTRARATAAGSCDPGGRAQNLRSSHGKLLSLNPRATRRRLADRRVRPAEPLGLLLRPRERAPVHRRRRSGPLGGGRHAGSRQARRHAGELHVGRLEGRVPERLRDRRAPRPRGADQADLGLQPLARLLDHRRLRLPRPRISRAARAGTSSRDFCSGRIWRLKYVNGRLVRGRTLMLDSEPGITSFGEGVQRRARTSRTRPAQVYRLVRWLRCATSSSTAGGSWGSPAAGVSSTSRGISPARRSWTWRPSSRRRPSTPGGRHPLPAEDDFARAAGAAGIGHGVFVVAYDQGMNGGAARLWWLLRHFGHDDVAVLDGGIGAWLGPLRAGEEDDRARRSSYARLARRRHDRGRGARSAARRPRSHSRRRPSAGALPR